MELTGLRERFGLLEQEKQKINELKIITKGKIYLFIRRVVNSKKCFRHKIIKYMKHCN